MKDRITLEDLFSGDRKGEWSVAGIQRCFLPLVEHLPHTYTTINRGARIFRGRPHQIATVRFNRVEDVYFKDRKGVKMGRANLDGQAVFYGSGRSEAITPPLGTVCMELSKRMRNEGRGPLTITVGVWEALEPIETYVFHSPDIKVNDPKSEQAKAELVRMQQEIPHGIRSDVLRLQALLDREFCKRVSVDDSPDSYIISAAFSDLVFRQYGALAYPSVEMVAGQNVALTPVATAKLRPIGALLVQFDFDEDGKFSLTEYENAQGAGDPWKWTPVDESITSRRPFVP